MKFLIFEMKTVCYNSYLYFGDALGQSLTALGHEVEYFKQGEDSLDELEKYVGTTFDALIDFNSDLPRALMDDDSYFLDHVDAPFFDIILDHPLYHHDSLKHKLSNFHIICLDDNHKSYIEKYYPHIKSVTATPMTGEIAFGHDSVDWDSFENRKYDILFSGTYTDPVMIEAAIHKIPKFLAENVYTLIDMQLKDTSLTIESAVEQLAENEIYDYINTDLPLHTQSFYLADAYVRCYNRKKLVQELDKCSHPVHLFGSLWEELDLKHAELHREIPFNLTFTIFANSKLSTNIMPNFKAGSHDRVYSSQINGAAVLTDPTDLLLKEYKNNENILFYTLDKMDNLSNRIDELLDNPDKLIKIAQAGNKQASLHHTWANIAEVLLSELDN